MTHQQIELMFQKIEKEVNVKYNKSLITFEENIKLKIAIQTKKIELINRYGIHFNENFIGYLAYKQ